MKCLCDFLIYGTYS